MTRPITLTITLDLDNSTDLVTWAKVKAALDGGPRAPERPVEPIRGEPGHKETPPLPAEAGEAAAAAQRVFGDALAEWPAGQCPLHGGDHWRESNFGGMYCTSIASAGQPHDKKNRCSLKSGTVYEGRRIP